MARTTPFQLGLRFLAVLAAFGIVVELGARFLLRSKGTPWSGWQTRDQLVRRCQALAVPWDPRPGGIPEAGDAIGMQPYTGWVPEEVHERAADDLEAYRLPEAETTFDVCVLGGAAGAALARSTELAGELAADPRARGRAIRIHGYAIDGYKQPQPERLLTYLLSLGHRPDLVIEIDGLAECSEGWSNARSGTCPLYPSAARWSELSAGTRYDWEMVELLHEVSLRRERARTFGEFLLRWRLWESCALGRVGWLRFENLETAAGEAQARARSHLDARPKEAELRGPAFPDDDAGLVELIADSWEEAAINMHSMCAARGIPFLQVLEPVPAGTRAPEGVAEVLPELRGAGTRLASRGIAFLDATGIRGAPGSPGALAAAIAAAVREP